MKISDRQARAIAAAMKECHSPAERKAVVERFMAELSTSERSVYRAARKGGWSSGRKARADKGSSIIDEEAINTVIAMKAASKRKDRRCIMDTETALSIAVDSGLASTPVSASRMNCLLRARRATNRDLEDAIDYGPHINLRSLGPNHVHQFDITPCVQYFFDDHGLGHRDMKKEFYLGKPENVARIKNKLLRFVIIDHYSGSFLVKYFYAPGERAIDVAAFLLWSWDGRGRDLSRVPFRGLPEILVCDRGSAAMSELVTGLLESLRVERLAHLPGNPRAKGMVEGMMNIWEMKFESRLSVKRAPDLETLNAWALDFATFYNADKPLSRAPDGRSRSRLWLAIQPDRLRLPPPPEVCNELLHTRAEQRTVKSNLLISYKGGLFRVDDPNLANRKVTVTLNPYRWGGNAAGNSGFAEGAPCGSAPRSVDVKYVDPGGDVHLYEAREVDTDEAGFFIGPRTAVIGRSYDRHPDTITQKLLKQVAPAGCDSAAGDMPGASCAAAAFGGHADKVDHLTFLPHRGERIEIEEPLVPVMSTAEALLEVKAALGRSLSEHEAMFIQGAGPLTRDQVGQLAQEFLASETLEARSDEGEENNA